MSTKTDAKAPGAGSDTLSDSTIGMLRVAARETPPQKIRIRLLIALPVMLVLMLTVMAGAMYWVALAYISSGSDAPRGNLQDFSQDWLLLLGVCIVCAAIAGFVMAHSITAPVRKFIEISERIAAGDFSHKLSVQRPDEMGAFGSSFNHMLDALNGFI